MGLEGIIDKVTGIVKGIKDYFIVPGKLESMRQYAIDHYMDSATREQVFKDASPEQKEAIYRKLEGKIQESLDRHQAYLDKFSAKVGKAAGVATIVNDIYHFYQGTPFDDFFYFKALLVASKATLELPAMYHYLKDTHDYAGALEWLGMKAASLIIPVIGPALDQDTANRIVKKTAIKDGLAKFLKEEGLYKEPKPKYRSVLEHVENIAGKVKLPEQPGYQASPA